MTQCTIDGEYYKVFLKERDIGGRRWWQIKTPEGKLVGYIEGRDEVKLSPPRPNHDEVAEMVRAKEAEWSAL